MRHADRSSWDPEEGAVHQPRSPVATADPVAEPSSGCPACGGRDHALRFRVGGCDILQCRACGTGRTDVAGFDPAGYYTDDYFSGGHADGYADYLGAETVLRREFARTVDLLRCYRSGGRLLELGCAYGFFLMEAARHFDVTGVELAAAAAAHARRRGLNVLQGYADEDNFQRAGHADVIVMLDVIEHLPNPRETLALCQRFLNPGGIVAITTGDFGSLAARLAGARWRLMTPPQHLSFFTVPGLRALASDVGLSMMRVDHPWKIVPASLIAFQIRRMLGLRPAAATTSGVGVPVNLFDAMRVILRKGP
jgi:SAM-dependent methyltransferase